MWLYEIKLCTFGCRLQKNNGAPVEKKNDIYRYELMMPFKGKWDCYQIPYEATTPMAMTLSWQVICWGLFPHKGRSVTKSKHWEPFFRSALGILWAVHSEISGMLLEQWDWTTRQRVSIYGFIGKCWKPLYLPEWRILRRWWYSGVHHGVADPQWIYTDSPSCCAGPRSKP